LKELGTSAKCALILTTVNSVMRVIVQVMDISSIITKPRAEDGGEEEGTVILTCSRF
jgi:hypothetical protein